MNGEHKLKEQYMQRAIEEYEYSWSSEYDKRAATPRAVSEGTVDLDSADADRVEVASDGAWVPARVWIPKTWLD